MKVYKPTVSDIKEQAPKIFKDATASAFVQGWTDEQAEKLIDEITLDTENWLTSLSYVLPTTENGGAYYNIKRYISLKVIDHMGSASFINNLDDKYLSALSKRLENLENMITKSTPRFLAGRPPARTVNWAKNDILRK